MVDIFNALLLIYIVYVIDIKGINMDLKLTLEYKKEDKDK